MCNNFTVILGAHLNKNKENMQNEISKIFVAGFSQWLQFFSKDNTKLVKAFAHMFNLDVFYLAICDNNIAGIAACTDGKVPSVRLNKRELTRHLGLFKGNIAYFILRKEFEEKQYPFPIQTGMGTIEFVATSPKYRKQGVASTMIKHIFTSTPYLEYILEVADTNENAMKLYEKLGFYEIHRIKEKHAKRSGINYLVYMKYDKERNII